MTETVPKTHHNRSRNHFFGGLWPCTHLRIFSHSQLHLSLDKWPGIPYGGHLECIWQVKSKRSFSIITKSKVTNKIYIIHEKMHEDTVLINNGIFPFNNKIQRVILVISFLPWKGQPDHFQVKFKKTFLTGITL